MFKVTCGKCNGTGIVDCYRYNDAGVCYECKGVGFHIRKTNPGETKQFHVTAIIKEGYQNSGERGGMFVNARSEKEALRKAKLHPDSYNTETKEAVLC